MNSSLPMGDGKVCRVIASSFSRYSVKYSHHVFLAVRGTILWLLLGIAVILGFMSNRDCEPQVTEW